MNKFCKFTYFIVDYVKEAMLCIIMVEIQDAVLINHTKCHTTAAAVKIIQHMQ